MVPFVPRPFVLVKSRNQPRPTAPLSRSMSLLDDYQSYSTAPLTNYAEPVDAPEVAVIDTGFVSVAPIEEKTPMFALDKVQIRLSGALMHMAVSNNIIALALENNHLLRIDLDKPQEVEDIEISKRQDDRVHNIFFDPTGTHLLISLEGGENLYLHSKSKRPKLLSKLKGLVIDSVAWNKTTRNDPSTHEILLGTSKGLIFETEIEPTDAYLAKDEKFFKQVYKLPEPAGITGLRMEQFPVSNASNNRKYLVLATTTTRIYQFVGLVGSAKEGGIFEPLFAHYATNAGFQELPGTLKYSEIHFFSQFQGVAKAFAWLTGPGIYHGSLVFGSQNPGDTVIDNGTLLPYPQLSTKQQMPVSQSPLSVTITEFHFLLLFPDRFVAIGRLDEQVTHEELLPRRSGEARKIATDSVKNTIWVYSNTSIFEVVISDEDRNVWQTYLNNKQFDLALQYCKNPAQKDKVCTAQGDHYFSQGRYQLAASFYAQSQKSFEEVTLKFIRKGEREALKTFLTTKLNHLRPMQEATQITIISTWLVEIYLDRLNSLQDANDTERFKITQEEFFHFLGQNVVKEHLDHTTTYNLIASHGRTEELLQFAKLIEDYERVITHYIQQGDYMNALKTMTQQSSNRKADTFYKFSPILIEHIPYDLVSAWTRDAELNPKMLIPALMKYDQKRSNDKQNQAIRYLQHCVQQFNVDDPAIHNLLLTLYAQQDNDTNLRQFLNNDNRHYDLQYALRLCTQQHKTQASIIIYSAMGLYEEAVELSLQQNDLEMAKINADKPADEDEALRKKLWLRIARHVVEKENDIKKAMAFLRECELLKIEDVLPFFSDFVVIDDFKDEICLALEEYNRHIDELKLDMDEATRSAEAIRLDIRELRNRYCQINANEKCRLCRRALLTRQFYVFPCQHMFHADCLTTEIMSYLNAAQRARVQDLQQKIANESAQGKGTATATRETDDTAVMPKTEQLKNTLDDIIASECPMCGDIMIKSIEKPFLTEKEVESLRSWDLK